MKCPHCHNSESEIKTLLADREALKAERAALFATKEEMADVYGARLQQITARLAEVTRERDEARKDNALLRSDFQKNCDDAVAHCEGCQAPLFENEEWVSGEDCSGCWHTMTDRPDKLDRPCFAYRVGKPDARLPVTPAATAEQPKAEAESKTARADCLKGLLAKAEDALKAYEAWEADLIVNGDWSGEGVAMSQAQHDEMMKCQALRNTALSEITATKATQPKAEDGK